MRTIYLPCIFGVALLVIVSCDQRPEPITEKTAEPVSVTKTFETATLDRAMAAYRATPTEQTRASVDRHSPIMAKMELKQSGKPARKNRNREKLADLQAYREKPGANYAGEKPKPRRNLPATCGRCAKDVGRNREDRRSDSRSGH
jgi:hypothetical protein